MPNTPRDNVCVFITDAGEIAEYMSGCPESISLANAALCLEQNLNSWDKDEEGWSYGSDEEGWPDLWSCEPAELEHANVTVFMVRENRFHEGMAAQETVSAAFRNLGRVRLTISSTTTADHEENPAGTASMGERRPLTEAIREPLGTSPSCPLKAEDFM